MTPPLNHHRHHVQHVCPSCGEISQKNPGGMTNFKFNLINLWSVSSADALHVERRGTFWSVGELGALRMEASPPLTCSAFSSRGIFIVPAVPVAVTTRTPCSGSSALTPSFTVTVTLVIARVVTSVVTSAVPATLLAVSLRIIVVQAAGGQHRWSSGRVCFFFITVRSVRYSKRTADAPLNNTVLKYWDHHLSQQSFQWHICYVRFYWAIS